MKKIFLGLSALFTYINCYCDVRLPAIFGDNMVLQRNQLIPVWGLARPGEKIIVSFNKQSKKTIADEKGRWMVRLERESAGGPFVLYIRGENTIRIKNVLVGEVWICAGQSNMELEVRSAKNARYEIAHANEPQIRHFKIPAIIINPSRKKVPAGEWKVCDPRNAGVFSAAGYFFAKELYRHLKVPVGLINASWGGTVIETWISHSTLQESDEFRDIINNISPIDLDSLENKGKIGLERKLASLQGALEDTMNEKNWNTPAINDNGWPTMKLPCLWEAGEVGDMDGVVWFRKHFGVQGKNVGQPGILKLGKIDDRDRTYVNGTLVGKCDVYNKDRTYRVPPGLIKAGDNVIAVRVEDTGGGGGLYSDSQDLRLKLGNLTIPLAGAWNFKVASLNENASYADPNGGPGILFNSMIKPLIPFACKGVLWYQGESNAGRAFQYRKALPLLIADWRRQFEHDDLSFVIVQLPGFNANNGNSNKGSTWAELRESQSMALSLPNTGMIVTSDIGDPTNIHPMNKQDVGKRLAAAAMYEYYGHRKMPFSGPLFLSMDIRGNDVIVSFKHAIGGLTLKKGDSILTGFEIAGSNQHFYAARAHIQGDRVWVHSDSVPSPLAIRYGWADDNGKDNLYNKDQLPAAPFRTDDWPAITSGEVYRVED